MRRVVLHIDRVLLRGFDRGAAGPLVAGLRAELTSLLAGEGAVEALSRHHTSPFLKAGSVPGSDSRGPEVVGRNVAGRIIHGGRQ